MRENFPFDLSHSARVALRCLDLTSLNHSDTEDDIAALCARAQTPFGPVAAVCVWPRFVGQARRLLPSPIQVAAVANFPEGARDLARALEDVNSIVAAGGNEVDVVLPYKALQQGQTRACADFLAQIRVACGPRIALKVIIESGELSTPVLIAQATQLAIAAGADFVKTSTGKTPVSATPEAALVMLEEIAQAVGRRVGFKASGGIRTVADAQPYLTLVAEQISPAALVPTRFRIGASSLLSDILNVLSAAEQGLPPGMPQNTSNPHADSSAY